MGLSPWIPLTYSTLGSNSVAVSELSDSIGHLPRSAAILSSGELVSEWLELLVNFSYSFSPCGSS